MITPAASSADCPLWAPWVITRTRGSPRCRRDFLGGGGGDSSSWGGGWSEARMVRPNRSLRITETADRMNSHSRARKSTLMTVRAISDMWLSTGRGVDQHAGGSDLDPRPFLQHS